MKLAVAHDGPAATASGVHFTDAFPREIDALAFIEPFNSTVEPTFDRSELKRTLAVILECDVSWNDEIDVVAIPLLHFDNTPPAEERARLLGHG